jgi:glycosyltransferase involved in cell wall biosynthesis
LWGDVNWVHYVHGAFKREPTEGLLRRLKTRVAHRRALTTEERALRMARVAIVNSNRTKRDLIERLGLAEDRVHTVYLGIDPDRFAPATPCERAAARYALGWPENRPTVAFVGALGGDQRKGFDTLYRAWEKLCTASEWDGDLAVVGAGAELAAWKARAAKDGVARRIYFLGFRSDVPAILRACDAMVAPARYEAYGLGVQEALCCGLPALVSADAGVAERYPWELKELLIRDAEDAEDLAARLVHWRANMEFWKERVLPLALELRKRTWHEMASEIVSIVDSSAQASPHH